MTKYIHIIRMDTIKCPTRSHTHTLDLQKCHGRSHNANNTKNNDNLSVF